MKDLADRLKISVIRSYARELEADPPILAPETFDALENSFMIIGKILTDHLERNQSEKERSVSREILSRTGL